LFLSSLSGGYIFDTLDKEAHKLAIEALKTECVTKEASIKFKRPVKPDMELETILDCEADNDARISCVIMSGDKIYVEALFVFAKCPYCKGE